MKFRKLVIIFILAVVVAAYFTKPTKDDFIKYIQPTVLHTGQPPVVDYQDKFLYANVATTFVDIKDAANNNGRLTAPASKATYIGLFGRFWKVND